MGLLNALTGAFRKRVNLQKRFDFHTKWIQGSAGVFHIVTDKSTKEKSGLKIIDGAKQDQFRKRFSNLNFPAEAEISLRMIHQNIVRTFETGRTSDDQEFMRMEYVDGPLLEEVIERRDPRMKANRTSRIRQIASAIMHVHEAGFIHRDICPRNLICDRNLKTVKLFDFGLALPDEAEFRQPKNRTGTPLYMAPEIVRRRATDHKVDIFAFGITAYQMLTFEHPWDVTENSGKSALLFDSRPPTDIREHIPKMKPRFAEAIHSCLEADASKRCNSMRRFLIASGLYSSESSNTSKKQ